MREEEFRQIDKLKRLQTNIRILKKGCSDKKNRVLKKNFDKKKVPHMESVRLDT